MSPVVKTTVMLCAPAVLKLAGKLAWKLLPTVAILTGVGFSSVVPSKKLTVPVGVATAPVAACVTVAVSVTLWFTPCGFVAACTTVVVAIGER